jgi:hypothetical protein
MTSVGHQVQAQVQVQAQAQAQAQVQAHRCRRRRSRRAGPRSRSALLLAAGLLHGRGCRYAPGCAAVPWGLPCLVCPFLVFFCLEPALASGVWRGSRSVCR